MPVCLGYFLLQSCAALAFEQREHRGLARSLALLGRGRVVRTGGLLGVAFDWAGASAAAVRAAFAGFVALAVSCWARSMSCSAILISSSSVSPRRWTAFQILDGAFAVREAFGLLQFHEGRRVGQAVPDVYRAAGGPVRYCFPEVCLCVKSASGVGLFGGGTRVGMHGQVVVAVEAYVGMCRSLAR